MHPLCCITLESPGIGDGSPEPTLLRTGSAVNFSGGGSEINVGGSDVSTSTSVAGILYKWTNYGKGWRSRWFTLRNNGVLSYSRRAAPTRRREAMWLKQRLLEEGIGEGLVKDCEQIMLSEFSGVQGQFQILCEERSNLLDTLRQLEAANIEAEASGINDEWSTTESSDDVEKQELEEASDEEETHFFDTNEYFAEPTSGSGSIDVDCMRLENQTDNMHKADVKENVINSRYYVERRTKLPDPIEKEKVVSLWSMIKDNIGKDLTRAYEHGKAAVGNSLMRILYVAAFAVSGYASSEGRHCKPFNPLLGETYEADFPEKGIRFFSEKVSHHPTVIACHCEGKGWKFWCDTNLKSKFWGRSIQLDPVGTLNLEFEDGEIFQWSKVTTSIYNLILGNIYCDHHGTMHIQGNRQYSCKLKFKEQSILERNPHQVHGFVEDVTGKKVAQLFGKWDDSMYFVNGEGTGNVKDRTKGTGNEKLPPTDSRLRPDQRHLENGEFDKANAEKLRLEMRQRMNMVGNPDGSIETVKDRSVTLADTGKPESNGIGMDALIFLVRLVKTLLIPSKVPDLRVGQRKAFRKASGIL
ncbi:hypothetical protein DH2020_027598 [Rehmannia glutinosa]|uniref:Oxysterol-binding protein-related protein 2A n=1 Tax=Rehmannia glutinosa TaxID=99300 RepID=A0ABR0VX78_REHGL